MLGGGARCLFIFSVRFPAFPEQFFGAVPKKPLPSPGQGGILVGYTGWYTGGIPNMHKAKVKRKRTAIVLDATDRRRKERLDIHGRPVSYSQVFRAGLDALENRGAISGGPEAGEATI